MDNIPGLDQPWHFGTAQDYPVLRYGAMARAPQGRNYDLDDDNLIDLHTLADLNAVRYDLDGSGAPDHDRDNAAYYSAFPGAAAAGPGCPAACNGYELRANPHFQPESGAGWNPIGGAYNTKFEGNGHTISRLYQRHPAVPGQYFYRGLFRCQRQCHRPADPRSPGPVARSGGPQQRRDYRQFLPRRHPRPVLEQPLGGLVGYNNGGTIQSSYARVWTLGRSTQGGYEIGALVGESVGGSITDSFATGNIRANGAGNSLGGLVGKADANLAVTNSYWDTGSTGQGSTAGGKGEGKTTTELQSINEYTGIYANWNANLDGETGNDDPWHFDTALDYPILKYDGAIAYPQRDYDRDDDNLIAIASLPRLNAIR